MVHLPLLCLERREGSTDVPPAPPAPTKEGEGRYFYLWHRPNDLSSAYPEGVHRIVASGGIVPGYARGRHQVDPRGQVQEMRPRSESGFSENIRDFLNHNMNIQTYLTPGSTGCVAWFYLNGRALEHAKEDELVFRVPRAWLEYNALFCAEQPPRNNKDRPNFMPWGVVMDLKLPLAYRITSAIPLSNEETRVMSNYEVGQMLYDAHRAADPKIRDLYVPEPKPESPRPSGPRPHINPF